MKKSILMLVAIIAAFQVSTAQDRATTKGKSKTTAPVVATRSAGSTPSTTAAPFWTDDFSTPANWTISNQAGNSDNWVIGTNPPSGSFAIAPIASTTASNGFALFDSDLLCSGNQIADLTTANPIVCTGMSPIQLTFEQFYRRFDDSTIVFVSNDNVNWTAFPVNSQYTNNTGSVVNPEIVNLDITSVAGNQATVWIRFEFYSPSTFVGPGNAPGCAYSWMVDDVALAVECTPAVAAATSQIVCPGGTTDLSITGGSATSYQWEESPDSINWTPIGGATGTTYTATVSAHTFYRAVGTCTGGLTNNSNIIEVVMNPTDPFCFCIPWNFTCDGMDFISDINITGTTLSHVSDCDTLPVVQDAAYTFVDPSTTTATLTAGTTYTLNVTTTGDHIISVWFDFDQDGDYAAAEWTQVATTTVAGTPSSVNIMVPSTALNGTTGMRVRSRLATFANGATDACLSMGSGETEDYFVTITGGVGVAENAFSNATIKPTITSDVFSVDLGTSTLNNARLTVTNMQGQAVISNQPVSGQRFDVSLGSYEAGLYLVRVTGGTSNFTGRVTVVK